LGGVVKNAIFAGFVGLCLAASAANATPLGEFSGFFNERSASAGCNGYPNPQFDRQLMRYFPAGVGGNGDATGIVLRDWNLQGPMQNYYLASGTLVGSSPVVVQLTVVGGIEGFQTDAKVMITEQTPAIITNATQKVSLAGKIIGFGGNGSCTVSFSSVLYSY
jgi:hypothetical protein